MRTVRVALFVVAGLALCDAQGLPSNYKLQFENAWVRVTEVRYGPREKVAPHAHTPYPSAYVYLNDGPPVIFKHVGGKGMAATRPATKAGAFRVYKGLEETHEVENTGDAPSEFLRVELKTAPVEPGTFFGTFERSAAATSEAIVHLDHRQLRVSRIWIAPGQSIEIAPLHEPVLVIALANGAGIDAGQTRWLEPSARAQFTNASATPIDLLRFDFKTSPARTRQ
jgi:hypothetical protein